MRKRITALLLSLLLVLAAAQPAAAVGTRTATDMAGLTTLHRKGLDGTGTVIAVIDSGIDIDHPAFSAAGMDESAVKLTEEEVRTRFFWLKAARYGNGVWPEEVYVSAKIPFAFDYTDGSVDVSHTEDGAGDHGTGVACAAAGAATELCAAGAAPGAQLLIMKVFPDHASGASNAAMENAIYDAIQLGADVINLSLGEVNNFYDGENTYLTQLQAAAEAGIVICAAAGNERSSAYKNNSGRDLSTTGSVDIGVLSRPGNMQSALSVASVNNEYFYANGIAFRSAEGKERYATFLDNGPDYGLREFTSLLELEGHENGVYEYAVVPGIGTPEDFAQVDVRGRLALVCRGEITFVEKSDNAFACGAVGVVVYNNVSESVKMDLTLISEENDLPCVIISQGPGEELVAAAGEDGVGELTVLSGKELREAPDGGEPSVFSSWGALSDLTLKPELSGVGGYVWTAVDGGGYKTLNGTSFATPQAAGAAAVLLQYVRQQYGLTGAEARERVQTLLMNTAQPQYQDNGVEFSPRKQGAGLIRADRAASTPVYVTVDGCELPKAELGDDKAQTGTCSFTFTVHNTLDTEVRYVLHAGMNTETAEDGYMLQQARRLDCRTEFTGETVETICRYDSEGQLLRYDVNGDGRLTLIDPLLVSYAVRLAGETGDSEDGRLLIVPAGGDASVNMTVRLTDRERERLDGEFENGIYVEGYLYLDALDVISPTVSVPILAFYGDWGKAPLFERTSRAELDSISAEGKQLGNSGDGFAILLGEAGYIGQNPVGGDEVYIPERSNAVSTDPKKGGIITGIELDLLRNAREVKVEFVSRGRVLAEHTVEDLVKSNAGSSSDGVKTVSVDLGFEPARYGLGNGSTFTVRITGTKDADGPYAVESMEIPVYVDNSAPVIRSAGLERGEDGQTRLKAVIWDNFYTAGLYIYTADMRTLVGAWDLDQQTKGDMVTANLDVTGLGLENGRYVLVAEDYAQNTSLRYYF